MKLKLQEEEERRKKAEEQSVINFKQIEEKVESERKIVKQEKEVLLKKLNHS